MVKHYYQLINDELKFVYEGDLDGLRAKVDKELGGDIEEARKIVLNDIAEGEKKILEFEEKKKEEGLTEVQVCELDVKIANTKRGIAMAKHELETITAIDKSKLKIYEFTPVEL